MEQKLNESPLLDIELIDQTNSETSGGTTSGDTYWIWLAAGIIITALVNQRFNIAVLGWVAAVPWLIYLRRTSGWRSRALFMLALELGAFLQVLKVITEPIPWFFALLYSVPGALFYALVYILFEAGRRRLGDRWGLVLYPAMLVSSEWVLATFSPMGTISSLAYTQLGNLPLLQVTSLFGLAGVTVLLASASALVTVLIDSKNPRQWRTAALVLGSLVIATYVYGTFRMHKALPGPLVTVAAVSSDIFPFKAIGNLPSKDEIATANDALFARSLSAMRRGAQIVVWNEVSTIVEKSEEETFVARGQVLAREQGADLVLAYAVSLDGLSRFENKYVWLAPDGPKETYFKHHPVPTEGSVPGTDPIKVLERPYGKVGGAICYDYDFPPLARQHAIGGAGLVVLPSSDWRGMDPYHTQMARVRGIEGGFSVVRSVHRATSGAYDALGRTRATSSWFEGERLMIARVPVTQIPTLYTRIGDVLPLLAFFVLFVSGYMIFHRAK